MDLWMDRWLVGWLDGAAENNNWSKSECKLSTDGNYQGQSRCQSVDAEMAALNCLKRRIHQFQIHREKNVSYSICIVRCFWIFKGILFLNATKNVLSKASFLSVSDTKRNKCISYCEILLVFQGNIIFEHYQNCINYNV